MEKEPLFSIITVVYNDGDNLEKTMNSIAAQHCKDYEFIVIDGGSKDHSLAVIKKFESIISFWISEADTGIYDAMNKGIKAAKGKYLHFLNAGDAYFAPDTLGEVKEKVQASSPIEIVYGKTIYQGNNSYNIKGRKLNYLDAYFSIPFCHQSMFFARSLFKELGSYETNYTYAADYAWMSQYINKRKKLNFTAFIDLPISVYMDGGASFINRKKVVAERKRIAREYFPRLPYYTFLLFIPFIQLKNFLLQIMIRLEIIDYYRRAKHLLSLSFQNTKSE